MSQHKRKRRNVGRGPAQMFHKQFTINIDQETEESLATLQDLLAYPDGTVPSKSWIMRKLINDSVNKDRKTAYAHRSGRGFKTYAGRDLLEASKASEASGTSHDQ